MNNVLIPQEVLDSLNHVQYYIDVMNSPEKDLMLKPNIAEHRYGWDDYLIYFALLPALYMGKKDIYEKMEQLNVNNLYCNSNVKSILFKVIDTYRVYNIDEISKILKTLTGIAYWMLEFMIPLSGEVENKLIIKYYTGPFNTNISNYCEEHVYRTLLSLAYMHNINNIREAYNEHAKEVKKENGIFMLLIVHYCISKNINIEDAYENLVKEFLSFDLSIEEYYRVEKMHNILYCMQYGIYDEYKTIANEISNEYLLKDNTEEILSKLQKYIKI